MSFLKNYQWFLENIFRDLCSILIFLSISYHLAPADDFGVKWVWIQNLALPLTSYTTLGKISYLAKSQCSQPWNGKQNLFTKVDVRIKWKRYIKYSDWHIVKNSINGCHHYYCQFHLQSWLQLSPLDKGSPEPNQVCNPKFIISKTKIYDTLLNLLLFLCFQLLLKPYLLLRPSDSKFKSHLWCFPYLISLWEKNVNISKAWAPEQLTTRLKSIIYRTPYF